MHKATLTLINKSKIPSTTITLPLSIQTTTSDEALFDGDDKYHGDDLPNHDYDFKYWVEEEDKYEVKLELIDDALNQAIDILSLTINEVEIGTFVKHNSFGGTHSSTYYWTGNTKYTIAKEKPFFLFYDQISMGVKILGADYKIISLVSPKIICQISNLQDNEQIKAIIEELTNDANNDALSLMFAPHQSYLTHSSLSIKNFNKLIGKIINCYQTNLVSFTTQAKYKYAPSLELTDPSKIRTLSPISFQYLAQDPSYNQKTQTFSQRIPAFQKIKSFKNKENIQLCIFLFQVLANTIKTHNKLESLLKDKADRGLNNHQQLMLPLEALNHKNMAHDLNLLKDNLVKLKQLKHHYEKLFGFHEYDKALQDSSLNHLPALNNVYQQIAPYHQVYACMRDYFSHNDCSLNKECLLLEAKTLDNLFEFYCLYYFINMLIKHGFTPDQSKAPISYQYRINHDRKVQLKSVANTYFFNKSPYSVTLYYQPIVSSSYIENSNMLFRTTVNKEDNFNIDYNFYNPDFVLKISSPDNDEYLIFDAKYSRSENIINIYLNKLIEKYCLNTSCLYFKQLNSLNLAKEELSFSDLQGIELGTKPPKMMYALQGKVGAQIDDHIWHYHDSPISSLIAPPTKIGILELNASHQHNEKILWDEICSVLPELKN